VRYGSLEPPPNEGFIELMHPEDERHGREQEVIVPSVEVPVRVDSDGSDNEPPDKVAFGRETHGPNVSPSWFAPVLWRLFIVAFSRENDRMTSTLA
jgi:hypothetical protein